MSYEAIKEALRNRDYDFLRTERHLAPEKQTILTDDGIEIGKGIILLGLGGSYAYGTNVPTSDIDVRGICLNSRDDILAGTVSDEHFEQVVNVATDTTIYSLNKIVNLMADVNPNTIEMMGLDEDQYLYLSEEGRMLKDNAHVFLSKKCASSFGGYANSQLYRLTQKSAHAMGQADLEKHILKTLEFMQTDFNKTYSNMPGDAIKLYIDKAVQEGYDTEIFMDVKLTHYPLRDYCRLWNELKNTVSSYGKIGKRNQNALEHDKIGKHMMHLVRLYLMCFDILEKEQIITHRTKDHDMLMDIRNGKYITENNDIRPEFFEMVNELEKHLQDSIKHTSLPDKPDYKKIRDLVSEINLRVINGEAGRMEEYDSEEEKEL